MNYSFLILFLLSTYTLAEECVTESFEQIENLTEIGNHLGFENCLTLKKQNLLRRSHLKACKNCKINKDANAQKKIQDKLTKSSLKFLATQFETSLSQMANDLLNLKGQSTSADYSQSIKACNTQTLESNLKGCNPKNLKLLNEAMNLKDSQNFTTYLQGKISTELARKLSPNLKDNKGFFDRSKNQNTCNISEDQIDKIQNKFLSNKFSTQEFNSVITKLKTNNSDLDYSAQLSEALGGNSDFKHILLKHPVIWQQLSSAPEGPNKAKLISILENAAKEKSLTDYFNNSKTQKNLDQSLAQNCEHLFSNFKKAVCSTELENGQINMNDFSSQSQVLETPLTDIADHEFAVDPKVFEANQEFLYFCETKRKPQTNSFKLNQSKNDLQLTLNPSIKDIDQDGKKLFYNTNYSTPISQICENLKDPKKCQEEKNKGSYYCALTEEYKKLNQDKKIENSKKASASELMILRSMVQSGGEIDEETKQILIDNGILDANNSPKSSSASTSSTQKDTPSQKSASNVNTPKSFTNVNPMVSPSTQPIPTQTTSIVNPAPRDSIRDMSELSKTNQEILRRLQEMKKSQPSPQTKTTNSQKPITQNEIRQMAQNVKRDLNLPQTVDQIANDFTQKYQNSISPLSKMEQDKKANASWNKALMNMGKGQEEFNPARDIKFSMNKKYNESTPVIQIEMPSNAKLKANDLESVWDNYLKSNPEAKVLIQSKRDFKIEINQTSHYDARCINKGPLKCDYQVKLLKTSENPDWDENLRDLLNKSIQNLSKSF